MADEHVPTAPWFLKLVFGMSINCIEGLKLCLDCVVFAGNLVVKAVTTYIACKVH